MKSLLVLIVLGIFVVTAIDTDSSSDSSDFSSSENDESETETESTSSEEDSHSASEENDENSSSQSESEDESSSEGESDENEDMWGRRRRRRRQNGSSTCRWTKTYVPAGKHQNRNWKKNYSFHFGAVTRARIVLGKDLVSAPMAKKGGKPYSQINKLMYVTYVPTQGNMGMSCQFGWAVPQPNEPQDSVSVWAYSWRNKNEPPYKNPWRKRSLFKMGYLKANKEYILTVTKTSKICKFVVTDPADCSSKSWSSFESPQQCSWTCRKLKSYKRGWWGFLYYGGQGVCDTNVTMWFSKSMTSDGDLCKPCENKP